MSYKTTFQNFYNQNLGGGDSNKHYDFPKYFFKEPIKFENFQKVFLKFMACGKKQL